MAISFTQPHLDLLTNTRKSNGSQNSYGDNSSISRRDNFSPLESPYYAISEQMRRELQPLQPQTSNVPNLSTLLQTAQSEIRKISKHIDTLKNLASRSADATQSSNARDFFQKDFYSTLNKINESANNMNWNGMIVSNGNERYRINQTSTQNNNIGNDYSNTGKAQNVNNVNGSTKSYFQKTDTVDSSEIPGAQATSEITASGNLNAAEPIIVSIGNYTSPNYSKTVTSATTLKLSDGSTVVAKSGTYRVGHSIPQKTSVQVYDSQGNLHNIPIQLEKTEANKWQVSLSGLRYKEVTISSGDEDDEDARTTTVQQLIDSYAYVKENDGSYTQISFLDASGTLTTCFEINFNPNGETNSLMDLSTRIQLVYNFDQVTSYYKDEDGNTILGTPPAGSDDVTTYSTTAYVQRDGSYTISYLRSSSEDDDDNAFAGTKIAVTTNPPGVARIGDQAITTYTDYPTIVSYNTAAPIIGASPTGSSVNFIGLTQYAGENTAYLTSDGATAAERESNLQQNQPQTQNDVQINVRPVSTRDDFRQFGVTPMPIHNNLLPNDNNSRQPIININLINLHTNFLGTDDLISPQGRFLNPFDQQRYDSFSGNVSMQNNWTDIVKGASRRNLNSIDIMSQRNADIALRVIEGALSQVQRELSNINSYIQRFIQQNNLNNQNLINNSLMNNNRIDRYNFV